MAPRVPVLWEAVQEKDARRVRVADLGDVQPDAADAHHAVENIWHAGHVRHDSDNDVIDIVRHMTRLGTQGNKVKTLTNPLAGRPVPIGDVMRIAHRRLVSHLDTALRRAGWTGVSAAHASVLATVDAEGSRLSTLVARGGRTKQATAELASHLVSEGHLRVIPDPSDGRAKLFMVTEDGLRLLGSCATIIDDHERWLDNVLGSDAVAQLRATLLRIIQDEG